MSLFERAPTPRFAALKRRAAYSLAASAAGMAASQSDAAVVVSPLQSISIAPGNSQQINIDGDAFNDIRLKNYIFSGGGYQGASVNFAPGQLVGFSASGLNYAKALGVGATIDSTTVGPSFSGSLAYGSKNPNAQFNNAVDKFIGLSFPSGGNTYYGWVRVDVNNAAGTFVVRQWAYQNQAGVGLTTTAIPEPTTLGMLAAGAAGLIAWRKRKAV